MADDVGWGSGPWGAFPWGLGGGAAPASANLSLAIAVRENVVELFFTAELEITGVLGANDAGDPLHYTITPVAGSVGYDGLPARTVTVLKVENVEDEGHAGTILDLTLDRALSPFPARYLVTVQNLVTLTLVVLTPSNASANFYGVKQPERDPTPEGILPSRDIAHPDTLSSALDPLPNATDPLVLGTIPVDSSGDYATDEGIASMRKRIFRRLFALPNRFVHLGAGYGAGIQAFLKMISSPTVRQKVATAAEAQIGQEPDVAKVKVKIQFDRNRPDIARFVVLVKPTVGAPRRFDVPLVDLSG